MPLGKRSTQLGSQPVTQQTFIGSYSARLVKVKVGSGHPQWSLLRDKQVRAEKRSTELPPLPYAGCETRSHFMEVINSSAPSVKWGQPSESLLCGSTGITDGRVLQKGY